jgi:hypothetical protein
LLLGTHAALSADDAGPVYELRTYYAAPGKLDDLQRRFREHTTKFFEKHGMVNVGYWVPVENPDNKLIYLLEYPNRTAAQNSWKVFGADPDWKAAAKASEANGRLVAKVESVYLKPTDFSPKISIAAKEPARLFELRTYKTPAGKLPNLLSRFRDHTVSLFAKHGMTNVGYFVPLDEKKGSQDTLIYLLAHKDADAQKGSFASFRADSDWVAAKKASEVDGSLTTSVESVLLKPTDYSATK